MDLDSDYYSSRCKDINGLWLLKANFMTFVGGDSDHYTLFYFNVKELFTVVRVKMLSHTLGSNLWAILKP
jgi:hypothetical protein